MDRSLLVVIGVFMMFYLQPYRKQTEGEPITPSAQKKKTKKKQKQLPNVPLFRAVILSEAKGLT